MKGYQYDYTDSVLETSEQATNKDIEIVLGQGKSAKSGGLSLNDIYVTMFYDWDDSLIGTLTCGVGEDVTESVNDYVKEKFIHPDLQTNTNYSSKERTDNYRGEYPHTGPNSTDPTTPGGTGTVTNGSDYPLTNKLEYCFAGKTIHADAPYAGGWTKVSASNMSDTWTALDNATTFDLMPELGADGNPVDSSQTKPDMESFDFSDVTSDDIDGGTLIVKAVYIPGTWLDMAKDGTPDAFYVVSDYLEYNSVGVIAEDEATYTIDYQYYRINHDGYGVTRAKDPKVRMDITPNNVSKSFAMSIDIANKDVIPVQLLTSKAVDQLDYKLLDCYGTDLLNGTDKSESDGLGVFKAVTDDKKGYIYIATFKRLIDMAYDSIKGTDTVSWNSYTSLALFKDLDLRINKKGAYGTSTANLNNYKKRALACVQNVMNANGGAYPDDITYYQLQYQIATNKYLSASEAETFCKANYSWCN